METMHQTKKAKIKKFLKETYRVMKITRKPNKEEFLTTAKVTGIGAAIIGSIGFVIFMLKQLLLG